MPQYRTLNKDFFKKWSSKMAYVLGYIAADAAITIGKRGNHYLEITSVDEELPNLVRKLLESNHKIAVRKNVREEWKPRFRLQIGSKELVEDLAHVGILEKKAKRLPMPNVPRIHFRHFVRGYFDGDGNVSFTVSKRKDRQSSAIHFHSVFTSCSKNFLATLRERLRDEARLKGGSLCFSQRAYRLLYAGHDSMRLYRFMYKDSRMLRLERKQKYFVEAMQKFSMKRA